MARFVFYIVLIVLLSISKVSLGTEEELPKELFEFPKNDSFVSELNPNQCNSLHIAK